MRHAHADFFVRNSISNNLAFFDATRIFGGIEPQTESASPFLYIIIFQRWESLETLSSTRGGGN